jgi:hypothetical protein
MSFTLLVIQIVIYLVSFFIFRSTHINSGIVLLITLVTITINSFVFRFQRTTLGIARSMGYSDIHNLGEIQLFLTPSYVGLIQWTNTIIGAINFTLLGINIGWIIAVAYLAFIFIAMGVIDVFLPIPTHKYCTDIIKKHLNTQRQKSRSIETLALTIKVLGVIDEVKVF